MTQTWATRAAPTSPSLGVKTHVVLSITQPYTNEMGLLIFVDHLSRDRVQRDNDQQQAEGGDGCQTQLIP